MNNSSGGVCYTGQMFELASQYFGKTIDRNLHARLSRESQRFLEIYEDSIADLLKNSVRNVYTIDPRDVLRALLKAYRLEIDPSLFLKIGQEDNFEIWSYDYKFLGSSAPLISRLSYDMSVLLTQDWGTLFERDPFTQNKIIQAWQRLYAGERLIENVTDYHEVKETGAQKKSAQVIIKTLAIVKDIETGADAGVIGITHIKD